MTRNRATDGEFNNQDLTCFDFLHEAIRFEDGRILNPRFSQYCVPRFSDTPVIELVLLDRKDLPSAGAGEAPIAGIAPAVSNAIFDAVGVRLRALPLVPNGLKG